MTIIFIVGTAGQETKTTYIGGLAKRVPNSIYLNINNINQTFNQPAESEFTSLYSHEQRIVYPGHEAVLAIAADNLALNKVIILDGDFDYKFTAECIAKKFPLLQTANMFAFYLHHGNDSVATSDNFKSLPYLLQSQLFMVNCNAEIQPNLDYMLTRSRIIPQTKKSSDGILIMGAGVAGSAKTTHLKKTCFEIIDSVYVDKDTLALPFLDYVGAGMPSPYYNEHVKQQSYAAVMIFAMDNVKLHKKSLLDGCFGDRLTSSLISNHLAASKYITTVMYFHCSGPTQKKNILERGAQRDTQKLADLPEDRRINLQKHLKDFSQINPEVSLLYVDTEHRESTSANVEKIICYLLQSCLISLKMNVRIVPYDEQSCAITKEEAQGGLSEFLQLLQRTISNDQAMQATALRQHVGKQYTSGGLSLRNTIWGENINLMMGAGLKLPSGNAHLLPCEDATPPTVWRP